MEKGQKKKKGISKWFYIGAVLLIGVLIAAAVFKQRSKPKGEKVIVEKVEKRTITENVSASGKVFPEKEVKISSDVSGEIVELFVAEGDSVVAGQLLAKIDPEAYVSAVERGVATVNQSRAQVSNSKAGVERSRAGLVQAKAELQRIEAQIINAKAIHDRNVNLHKEGVISDADFDASLSNLKTLEANKNSISANIQSAEATLKSSEESVKAAEFTVQSQQASLKELKTNLGRTKIYSPTNGIVSMLNVEQGERVVGTIQMTGTELMRIANLNAMEVQVDVSENDVLRVKVNDDVDIEVDAYLDKKFKGKVTEIANSASNSAAAALTSDQVTNFVVKVRVDPSSYAELIGPNKKYPFRPGMSASVEIRTKTVEDVLAVPIQAVTTREDDAAKKGKKEKKEEEKEEDADVKEVIFIASADTARMIEVKTGIQDDSYIQILSGLEQDEEVITGPYRAVSKGLKVGSEIKVVDEEELYSRKNKG